MIGIIAVVFLAIVGGVSSGGSNNHQSASRDDAARQSRWVAISQEAVRQRMRDPQSARFRNVRFNNATLESERIPVVCGEVNSRNGFGGYSGFQRFVASGETLVFLEEDVSDFDQVWRQLCR